MSKIFWPVPSGAPAKKSVRRIRELFLYRQPRFPKHLFAVIPFFIVAKFDEHVFRVDDRFLRFNFYKHASGKSCIRSLLELIADSLDRRAGSRSAAEHLDSSIGEVSHNIHVL